MRKKKVDDIEEKVR